MRQSLQNQFNDLKTQLDKLADDASFNGINLLAGDKLKLTFNETGSSSIEIQGKNADGTAFGAVSSSSLGHRRHRTTSATTPTSTPWRRRWAAR